MWVSSSHLLPLWLEKLLVENFFMPCMIHRERGAKSYEKKVYCLDCCIGVCALCVSASHASHRLLQIRRYLYQNVVKLEEAHKLVDCDSVQSYTSNGAKVIFLYPRPPTIRQNSKGSVCSTCERCLQDRYLFCSISCKVQHIMSTKGEVGLSSFIFDCQFLPLPEPSSSTEEVEEEDEFSTRTLSDSGGGLGGVGCRTLACTATTDQVIVRKKRSNLTACRPMFPRTSEISSMNRRKKTPNRAPLY